MSESGGKIENVMQESRLFPPTKDFASKASIKSLEEYEAIYNEAKADPIAFWDKQAQELHWFKPYDTVLDWNEPYAKWFVGGQTNVTAFLHVDFGASPL